MDYNDDGRSGFERHWKPRVIGKCRGSQYSAYYGSNVGLMRLAITYHILWALC
jgi:hypothetical protein